MEDIEAVYRQYAKPVYGYLLGLCGNANDAEELTAETFYRAVSSIHRFKGECALLRKHKPVWILPHRFTFYTNLLYAWKVNDW